MQTRTRLSAGFRFASVFNRGYSLQPFPGPRTKPPSDFFNRTHEKAYLENLFSASPSTTVVLGPPDTGKTSLLLSSLQNKPVMHINLRKVSTLSTKNFVRVMQNEFFSFREKILDKVHLSAGIKLPGLPKIELAGDQTPKDLEDRWVNLLASMSDNMDINVGTHRFFNGSSAPYPILFIDEANKLEVLGHDKVGEGVLRDLADWMISISKEASLCHVVLASSDSFFTQWASTMFGAHFDTEVVGDLPETEALCYLKERWSVTGDRAKQLYGVYGGKIMHLRKACAQLLPKQDVRATAVYRDTLTFLSRAHSPEHFTTPRHSLYGPPLWTEEDLKKVISLLAVSPGYLPLAQLSGEIGEKKIWSLVRYNVLNYRPNAGLSGDLPGAPNGELVTPLTGCAWTVMKDLHQMGGVK